LHIAPQGSRLGTSFVHRAHARTAQKEAWREMRVLITIKGAGQGQLDEGMQRRTKSVFE
jgi:hypothetical protein